MYIHTYTHTTHTHTIIGLGTEYTAPSQDKHKTSRENEVARTVPQMSVLSFAFHLRKFKWARKAVEAI